MNCALWLEKMLKFTGLKQLKLIDDELSQIALRFKFEMKAILYMKNMENKVM